METPPTNRDNFSFKTRTLARMSKNLSCTTFAHLRTAIDWQDWHYNVPVKNDVYIGWRDGGEFRIAGTRVKFQGRWTDSSLILKAEGYYIRMTSPSVFQRNIDYGIPVTRPPIQVQCQGHAFSSGADVFEVARDIERMLDLDRPERIPGRCDIACDIWIKDRPGAYSPKQIFDTIVCHGDQYHLRNNWCSKSRRIETDFRVVGNRMTSPTLYFGSRKALRLCVYDKTADFPGNTRDIVKDQWIEAGYKDGEGLVCRFEYTVSREYIRKAVWSLDGETLDGSKINLEQFYACLPQLWATCVHRIRYCPDNGKGVEVRKRRVAPFWDLLIQHPPVISDDWLGPLLRYKKRGYDVDKLRESAVHNLINLTEAMGKESIDLVTVEAMANTTANKEYKRKSRWTGYLDRWKEMDYERITGQQGTFREFRSAKAKYTGRG